MDLSSIRTVGVAGAGTMGAGIAQLFVQNDIEVRLYDVSEEILSRGEERVLRGLQRLEKPEAFSLLRKTTNIEMLGSCDLVIEAVVEDLAVKQSIFRRVDAILDPAKILATNTSSLPVSELAKAVENPDRVIGLHFFNPAPIMKLVEVVRAERSSVAAVNLAVELAAKLGKTAVVCKDTPGFIANRVTRPYYLVGQRLLEAGAGTPAEIDQAMKKEGGFRMGPFELMDLIGLDVNLSISTVVFNALGKPARLQPCTVQDKLVSAGCLGRKNSRGFYVYGENPPGTVNPLLEEIVPKMGKKQLGPRDILEKIVLGVIEEARLAADEGVASRSDIDLAMCLGMNWPKGPFAWEKTLI